MTTNQHPGNQPPVGQYPPGQLPASQLPASQGPADQRLPGQQPIGPDRPSALPELHESWLPREHWLHRPRHGNRQRFALVCALVFFCVPLVSFGFGVRPAAFENHQLAGFPNPLDGWSFFTGLSAWATDQLAFREQAIHTEDGISRGVFGEPPAYGGGGQHDLAPVGEGPAAPPAVPASEFPTVLEGKDGWMYLGAELSSHCDPAQSFGATVAQLRQLRDRVQATGRQFYVVIAPDKGTMVPQYLPDDFPGKSCYAKGVSDFWHAVSTQDYVLDLRAYLRELGQQEGAPVYGPQDAHWSDEGGVLMTRVLAETLRPGISAKWSIQLGQAWQVPADLPPLIGQSGITNGHYFTIAPDGTHVLTQQQPTDYSEPLYLGTASGPGTYGLGVGLLADSFTIRATRYLGAAFSNLTILHEKQLQTDQGVAAGRMLANNSVVVLEVAERTLASGQFDVLDPVIENNIVAQLVAHPIR